MTETNESQENQNEEEAAVPTMTTVERAEMLLQQDAAIRAKINGGAEDEGAGGQRQNASLHGDSLFWIVRRTSTWMVPSVGSILRFPRNRR